VNPNRQAFLQMLSVSEGTSTSHATRNLGYDVIVTGVDAKPEIFTDYSAHPFANGRPSKVINSKGLTSNASGRYQFMLKDWAHYKAQLNLADFGPVCQDLWAIQLIRERGALPLIDGGQFAVAVQRCSNLWASLPGAGYGQPERSIEKLRTTYLDAGGELYADAPILPVDSTWGNEVRR
jgi:muramidase (phage lysozyme)